MPEDLSPNDIVMPKCYTQVLWIFDYVIDDLEKPLLKFLHIYCPTAFHQIAYDATKSNYGQLVESRTPDNRIFSREQKLDISIAHYINCHSRELNVFPYPPIPGDTSPLLFMHQITLQDGTLLAMGTHHHFCDGHASFLLIERFSAWIRGNGDSNVKIFIHDRSLLKPASYVQYDHPEYTTMPRKFPLSSLPPVDILIKRYTKQQLFEKLQITAKNVTLNDVVVAWLTQAISQVRQVSLDATVNVNMAYNGRHEWNVDPDYFGNCNFYICMRFSAADLNNCSVEELAQKINVDKKKYMSREYMASALAYVASSPETVRPNVDIFDGKDVVFTNWSRFPIYGMDFGHGPPKRFRISPFPADGLITIVPTPTDEIELVIVLKNDHAGQLLEKL